MAAQAVQPADGAEFPAKALAAAYIVMTRDEKVKMADRAGITAWTVDGHPSTESDDGAGHGEIV